MLLLDTHVWIWTVDGDASRVGRRAQQALARAEARGLVFVSPISVFEVAALHTAGRLRLTRPPDQWIREALTPAGVRTADLTPATAIDAGVLPRSRLADPIDRLLVATARQRGLTLLTSDARILDYASGTGDLRAQDAAR